MNSICARPRASFQFPPHTPSRRTATAKRHRHLTPANTGVSTSTSYSGSTSRLYSRGCGTPCPRGRSVWARKSTSLEKVWSRAWAGFQHGWTTETASASACANLGAAYSPGLRREPEVLRRRSTQPSSGGTPTITGPSASLKNQRLHRPRCCATRRCRKPSAAGWRWSFANQRARSCRFS